MTTTLPATTRPVTTVLDLIESRPPDAPAVVAGSDRLTYRDLDERANHLANRLARLGVATEARVGVFLERSAEALVAVLGVWKAGAAYVPLDMENAPERLRLIVADCAARVVVTRPHLAAELAAVLGERVTVLVLGGDEDRAAAPPPRSIVPASLGYVVYTSGSTGVPKGVMSTHEGLLTTYRSWERAFALRGTVTAHAQMANFGFDGYLGELVRALCTGAKLVVCPKEVLLRPDRLLQLLRREGVDAADFVPPVLRALVRHAEATGQSLSFLKMIIVGSDTYRAAELVRIRRLGGPDTTVINCYGLSEASIDSTCYVSPAEEEHGDAVLIGTPLPGTEIWILDDELQPAPPGATGTIYVAGPTLARGYNGDPAATAASFVPHPRSDEPGRRLYRTGDRARLRTGPGGPHIEFLGRQDHQIKVNGYRVELGEIEAALRGLPGVREAAVTADGGLRAHLVVADPAAPTDWAAVLRGRLPHYMRPERFTVHEQLPITRHGKLDRAALARHPSAAVAPAPAAVAPRSATERELAGLWATVLDGPAPGVHDDFFAAGGDSFLAMRLIALVTARWAVEPPVRSLFANPTVAGFAAVIDALAPAGPYDEIVPVPRELIEEDE
ncbi:non-ribosomal peptide synthetase [Dactylosporangium salmoneum]|uniref:Carrier domain-containing protein n=1 Tax=Dactylosporangium salmoneum TaxID=53361 RepID=A0ABP5TUM8_9ACTN